MSKLKNLASGQPKRVPRWSAYILFSIVWGVLPWTISLLPPRLGWNMGRPSPWNWVGLVPLLLGLAGSLWALQLHFAGSEQGLEWQLTRTYLLTTGPYAFSRHPMYLSELTLLLGWVLFYGSVAVLIAWLIWWVWFTFNQVPLEERTMQAQFGETYTEYESRVPRWLGRARR